MLSRGVRPVLVVGLAAVLLGACSGGGASTTQLSSIGSPPTSPLPAASPSLAALPSSSGTRAPSSAVRACRAGDVAAGAVWWTGATAEMAGGFALWDTASEPCSIGGRVTVQLLDGSGKALPLAVQPFETAAPVSVVLLPGLGSPTPGAAPQPGRAGVQTFWSNWCGHIRLGPGTLVANIPGIGRLTAPVAGLHPPRCDAPASPSVFSVGPILAIPSN